MEQGELDVAGVRRTYWLARDPGAQAPLLMMLPGSGTTGKDIATIFTGLATRGPAAGVTVVFPNGWGDVWHVAGPQYLPARVVGPIPRRLDATQILLDLVAARS
jgi:poly(3-hydroxybutyrate) depolymerase